MISDIELAKRLIDERDSAIIIVKNGQLIFESKEKGIKPLYTAFTTIRAELAGAALVDRVTGRAAAMLSTGAKIEALHAKLLSERAIEMLEAAGVAYSYDKLVPYIKNRTQTGSCPVEQLSADVTDVQVLVEKIKGFLEAMSN
ncbi:MAG: DUF1893 domain-containing protein [Clostridia bacterium]|nr:DUF1893 domain-containing protein [Clostridia bacterium]